MYVKDIMSTTITTIDKDSSVSKALDIMSINKFHRLPVVDDNGYLIGLLTESIISKNTPNDASSLSIFELNYLLNKLKVEDVMLKEVYTIGPDALLEEAAVELRSHEIGCLPVIREDKKLLGIITHNDIFDAFVDLLGYHINATRYVINIKEDKVGIMKDVSTCFADENISISRIAVYKTERGIELVVITDGPRSEKILKDLKDKGYNVTDVFEL